MTAEMFVEPRRAANAARASDSSVGQRNTSRVWTGRAGGVGAVEIDSGTVVIGLHVDVIVDEAAVRIGLWWLAWSASMVGHAALPSTSGTLWHARAGYLGVFCGIC
jgi:hypothetical protein